MCGWSFVLGKRRIGINQALDGALEKHHDHHDTENLKTVAGHVHHNGIHRDLLGRADGDLPRFLHFERVGVGGFLRSSLLLLLLALNKTVLAFCGLYDDGSWWWRLTCLPPRLLEKPGGSGMLDAAFEGRGIGEFSETTHCGGGGGGRRACDMMKICVCKYRVWGEMILKEQSDGGGKKVAGEVPSAPTPPSINSPFFLTLPPH
jgi:hypothetical protein